MKKIIILGGNGRLSREAALAFDKQGYDVTLATRNGSVKGSIPVGIKVIAVDCLNRQDVIAACRGMNFIFNGLNPVYTKWHSDLLPMVRNVIAAAIENDAIHLFPGNIYNYGSDLPPILTPDTAHAPDTRKGKLRVEAESLMRKAAQDEGLKTIIIRAGDYFGGTMAGAWFDDVVTKDIKKGVITYPGNKDIPHAWAYVPDMAKAFVKLANQAEQLPMFKEFAFAGHTITGAELHEALERIVDKPLKLKSLPWGIIKILGFIIPMMREVSEMSYLWKKPHQLEDAELTNLLAKENQTQLDAAIRQSLIDLDRLEYPEPVQEFKNA